MAARHFLIPSLVLGLSGVALYFSPCMSNCDEAAVAEGDADTPCNAHEALAAQDEEEPCPFAEEPKAEVVAAAEPVDGEPQT